ncbi:hypothetical protein [Cecembia rubra]|nr:hypothetical protein [Cecembia rubra]
MMKFFHIRYFYGLIIKVMIIPIFYITLIFLLGCNTDKQNNAMKTPPAYYKQENLPLYLPFSLHVDPMEKLLLVNFEKDPDRVYIGFEPQYFKDPENGEGLLVIAWRKDMHIDVYHESTLFPDPSKFDIAGKGLGCMQVVEFQKKKFEIFDNGVSVDIAFTDKFQRKIQVLISESNAKKRKPFGLLAPMGDAASNPSSMPLVFLYDFYFVRRNQTLFNVIIDNREHHPDKLPIPMDGAWMYFVRYSPDPFIVTFNPAQAGKIYPVLESEYVIELEKNGNGKEIKSLKKTTKGHQISLTFFPAFPQFNLIQDGIMTTGKFEIMAEESTGKVKGTYRIKTEEGKVHISINPDAGWEPKADRLSLKFLYAFAKTFKNWPKSYEWSATLKEENGNWHMDSHWKKL